MAFLMASGHPQKQWRPETFFQNFFGCQGFLHFIVDQVFLEMTEAWDHAKCCVISNVECRINLLQCGEFSILPTVSSRWWVCPTPTWANANSKKMGMLKHSVSYRGSHPGDGSVRFLVIVQWWVSGAEVRVFIELTRGYTVVTNWLEHQTMKSLIVRLMGPTWGPSGVDRTQVGPMLAPWTLLSGMIK